MSSYSVELTKSAKKDLRKLPKKIQIRIIEALKMLGVNPLSELLKVKKLRGEDSLYRIRVGDYRIVYTVENKKLVILVIKIGHRKEIYR